MALFLMLCRHNLLYIVFLPEHDLQTFWQGGRAARIMNISATVLPAHAANRMTLFVPRWT